MTTHKISVAIDIQNKDILDAILRDISKKYALDISLPISNIALMNQSLISLNKSFSIFTDHLSRIRALMPDLSAFYSAIAKINASLGPSYSPLESLDNHLWAAAAAALSALALQWEHLASVSSSPQYTSSLTPSSGYQPSGEYLSPLDLILSALDEFHNLPHIIAQELDHSIALLNSDFQAKDDDPYVSRLIIPSLKAVLQQDIKDAQKSSFELHVSRLSDIYDLLKFWLPSYYPAKVESILQNANVVNSADPEHKPDYISQQIAILDQDNADFNSTAIADLVSAYQSEMARLSDLKSLNLISFDDIIQKSWEYFRALKAIADADGQVSDAEHELLDIFRSRAQRAQLQKNSEGSDLTNYYNTVKQLDSAYYAWKKARIEEDVRLMDLSEEQKTALIKAKLDALKLELSHFKPDQSIADHLLTAIDIPTEHQAKIKNTFQALANQISAIWSQLYSNLASNRDQSLKEVENRAKKERKSDVWLASEKEKINADYEKKHKALKRSEQKMQIASATVNTMEGITNALTIKPAWLAPIMAAAVATIGFAQVKLIAEQKFARGGDTSGLFRGKGTTTSDSNIIAISDREYIIAADRVKSFGVPFFDALNFGNGENIRSALASIKFPVSSSPPPARSAGFASGGSTAQTRSFPRDIAMNVVLKCDGKTLAKAVAKGNKKIIST